MAAMKELATAVGIDYAAAPLAGRWEIDRDRNAVKVNRIRYPYPNRLGLAKN